MRSSQRPPAWRASRKLPTAATRDPKCRAPVGEGAKRAYIIWPKVVPGRAGCGAAFSGFIGTGRRGRRTAVRDARDASCASMLRVATGRASRRLIPISSPVSRQ